MMYRGYLIDRTPPGLTDSSLPWAFGEIGSGRGIVGWARTRKDAKLAVDRDIGRRERDAFARIAAEAGLTAALEPSGHTFVPGEPRPDGNPPRCHVCGAGPSRHAHTFTPDVDATRPAIANHPRQRRACGAGQFSHP